MKGYNTFYYLLFVILIMGAFASMAQNSYGLTLLGGGAIAFGILFLIQFITGIIGKGTRDAYSSIESGCLFILASLFALRVFYIDVPYVELTFGVISITLILIYFRKMINTLTVLKSQNILLSVLILAFYLVIILYFISLGSITFLPILSEAAGILAFVFLVGFVISGSINKNFLIHGEHVSAFKFVSRLKDYSILIVALFLLLSLYRGFTMERVLPKVYSDEFPQAYFELVNKAESGKENPVNGKYKYQEFKEKYDRFIKDSK